MIRLEDHRIFIHMSEPVRFIGLTVDELALVIGSFIGVTYSMGKVTRQIFWLMFGGFGIAFLKKFKKLKAGFNLKSFFIYYGIAPTPSHYWYPFHLKVWK